jgi:hypothetical protein
VKVGTIELAISAPVSGLRFNAMPGIFGAIGRSG